jgi:hypothetical protein
MDDERDEFEGGNASVQGGAAPQDASQPGNQSGNQSGNQGAQHGGPAQGGQGAVNGDYSQPQQSGSDQGAGQGAGAGPQPFIEGVPAEVALNPEAAGEGTPARTRRGTASGPEGEGRDGRRSRRPRRGERSRPDADDASDDQGGLAATLSRGGASAAPAEQAPEPKASGDAALADAEG